MFNFSGKQIKDITMDSFFEDEIVKINLGEIKHKYVVFVFYPLDFTFVCPTELKKISSMKESFDDLETSVFFCSNDSVYTHKAWCNASEISGGVGKLNFPMLSDMTNKLSGLFGVFNEEKGHVHRATIIYDTENEKIKHLSINDDLIGRSSSEIIRLIEALQFVDTYGKICPMDFKNNSNRK